jgi:hypothetical protein
MEQALALPEVVSMILDNIAEPPAKESPVKMIHDRRPGFTDLARLARVNRLWWKLSIKHLYRDVNTFHLHMLFRILHPDWKPDEVQLSVRRHACSSRSMFLDASRYTHTSPVEPLP